MITKNPNYEYSAERLTNPESVRLLLLTRLGLNSRVAELQRELEMQNHDLMGSIKILTRDLAANEAEIRNTVLIEGGYQDVDAGLYALRQRRVTYTYDPISFKESYPEYAPAVIKETVDTVKLGGLIKGGLLNMAALERDLVAVPSESFAFILRADAAAPEGKKE